MAKMKIEVVSGFCEKCGSETFTKSGRVAIGNSKGEPSKYTREICKKGCGWTGAMILEGGKVVTLPHDEPIT